jgi:XTP/dITP diphosphohydrolase
MPTLLLASSNRGKLDEINTILQSFPDFDTTKIRFVLPKDVGIELDVIEDGKTYAENAEKKALAYCQASGLITLADDSGIELDALDGRPGLYSARYSPKPNATDADRREFLIHNLEGHPQPWSARFRCTVAIAVPGEPVHLSEGICEGEIIPEERGSGGFGYDPIFFLPSLNKTMAELPMARKNALSHRGIALKNALPILRQLFNQPK